MLSDCELWQKVYANEPVTLEDLGLPSWRKDCDGFEYELSNLFCRSGIAYRHKDGYRWSTGEWLTKKECRIYKLDCGIYNV